MKTLLALIFFVFVCLSTNLEAQCYVSCPDGALAFSSLESYNEVVRSCIGNDRERFKILIADNKIRILEPGTIVYLQSKTELVAAVTIDGSSKLWAVPIRYISCKKDILK